MFGTGQDRPTGAHRGGGVGGLVLLHRAAALLSTALLIAVSLVSGVASGQPEAAAAGTVLINESFTGTSVTDPNIKPLGDACLTGAADGSTAPPGQSALSNCSAHPVGSVPPRGTTPGWLQFTDVANSRSGGIIYNQALPATNGLVVEFEQAQYGGSGADGISFFLSDGAYNLTTTGATGGSLGYAQKTGVEGVTGGFLGVALDAWGNYPRGDEGRGDGCTSPQSSGYATSSSVNDFRPNVSIRGPGQQVAAGTNQGKWLKGYCLWKTAVGESKAANQQPTPTAATVVPKLKTYGLRGSDSDASTGGTRANNAARTVRITVSPADSNGYTTVTVDIDFDGPSASLGWTNVLSYTTTVAAPSLYKFGFAASTGGSTDIHLIRNLKVETVDPLANLTLVKSIDASDSHYKAAYAEGDTIPYTFTVTNGGAVGLTGLTVTDPLVANISCPSTTLAKSGESGSTVTCRGTHVVTAAEAANAASNSYQLPNTATAKAYYGTTAFSDTGSVNATLVAPNPAIEVTKTGIRNNNGPYADSTYGGAARTGNTVTYTFTVKNVGNVTLNNVGLADQLLGWTSSSLHTCGQPSLAPGAQTTCTGTYTLTGSDVAAGHRSNTVTAYGTPASPLEQVHDGDTYDLNFPAAYIKLTKIVDNSKIGTVGAQLPAAWQLGFEPNGSVWYRGEQVPVNGLGGVDRTRVQPGDFYLKEAGKDGGASAWSNVTAPPGYSAGDWNCIDVAHNNSSVGVDPTNQWFKVILMKDMDIECSITNTGIPGFVTWSKTDATSGALVGGSSWTLTGPTDGSSATVAVSDCTAGSGGACTGSGIHDTDPVAGQFKVDGLEWGSYTLTESAAPQGYTANPNTASITISGSNAADGVALGAITNERIPGTVTWKKVGADSSSTLLGASEWQLVGPSGSGSTTTTITDCATGSGGACTGSGIHDTDPVAGQFTITGLAWGSYTLTETKAPAGYALDTTSRAITIGASSVIVSLGSIVNHQRNSPTIPLTGGDSADFYLILGGGTVIVTLLLGGLRQRRRRI
ncbi:DUF7507 domain-containing protein [Rarobacter incanus]|uniref:Putative repeat protein (TIGR01451 family) n=1 Tax=Rarobacter incanus TaxID=153494 RepID=A0A542SMK6_9MICO|nr:SpaA isopeptide-forming pilin-related protein [Rarobacter incanus]TQK75861.1 putative repeat protein (TIGR01451 family) [Rarobacter incanus]